LGRFDRIRQLRVPCLFSKSILDRKLDHQRAHHAASRHE
jgi:hypothetical protein